MLVRKQLELCFCGQDTQNPELEPNRSQQLGTHQLRHTRHRLLGLHDLHPLPQGTNFGGSLQPFVCL